jgi:hypothetical protein
MGVQNDMLYVTMVNATPGDLPFGSSSFQIVRRVLSSVIDDLSAEQIYGSIRKFHQKIKSIYNVFPRAWGGFYWPFYIEGGFPYVLLITFFLIIAHRHLLAKFLRSKSDYSLLNLFLFYASLCLGFAGSPYSIILPIVIASLLRPIANSTLSSLYIPRQTRRILKM